MGLKREMGLIAAINVILGVMIGSGIFISPQAALEYSGSIGACLVVWIACGVISLLGALCFAELGCLVPRSGAEYVYLIEAFAKTNKFWGPLPSFVCAWVYVRKRLETSSKSKLTISFEGNGSSASRDRRHHSHILGVFNSTVSQSDWFGDDERI